MNGPIDALTQPRKETKGYLQFAWPTTMTKPTVRDSSDHFFLNFFAMNLIRVKTWHFCLSVRRLRHWQLLHLITAVYNWSENQRATHAYPCDKTRYYTRSAWLHWVNVSHPAFAKHSVLTQVCWMCHAGWDTRIPPSREYGGAFQSTQFLKFMKLTRLILFHGFIFIDGLLLFFLYVGFFFSNENL
jgi:hypothetical protein